MRKDTIQYGLIIAALLLGLSIPSFAEGEDSLRQDDYQVMFFQNGNQIDIENEEVVLDREPFSIAFRFKRRFKTLLHAWTSSESYAAAAATPFFRELEGFSNTGMAETSFNEHKQLTISPNAPSYWHYNSKDDTRFDRVEGSGESITAYRTIRYIRWQGGDALAVENTNFPALYLIFVQSKYDKDYNEFEKSRRRVKISFSGPPRD